MVQEEKFESTRLGGGDGGQDKEGRGFGGRGRGEDGRNRQRTFFKAFNRLTYVLSVVRNSSINGSNFLGSGFETPAAWPPPWVVDVRSTESERVIRPGVEEDGWGRGRVSWPGGKGVEERTSPSVERRKSSSSDEEEDGCEEGRTTSAKYARRRTSFLPPVAPEGTAVCEDASKEFDPSSGLSCKSSTRAREPAGVEGRELGAAAWLVLAEGKVAEEGLVGERGGGRGRDLE